MLKYYFVFYIEKFIPRFIRRLWCPHLSVYSDPHPGVTMGMDEICKVRCTNCGKKAKVTAGQLVFGTWKPERDL